MNAHPPAAATHDPSRLLSLAMKIGPLLVAGAVGAAIAAAPDEAPSPVVERTQRYDDAMEALKTQRYSAAYGRFAALADQGHAPSALMALAMVTYRPTLVDHQWAATPAQLRRWNQLAMDEVRARSSVFATNDRGE